jgi:hypothetical protein
MAGGRIGEVGSNPPQLEVLISVLKTFVLGVEISREVVKDFRQKQILW